MPDILPFTFESLPVRVVERDDGVWFVGNDVCAVLDISNPRDAVGRLDDDEKDGVGITDGIGREQNTTIINESGLYSLILTSRKKEAKRFKKWVTAEVLPQIRKTGSYGKDPIAVLNNPEAMRGLLLTYSEKVIEQNKQITVMQPKVKALDRIATADGSLCITDAAKALQMRPKDLFAHLQRKGWIYRRTGGPGYLGYQTKVQQGLLEHKVTTIQNANGERIVEQVRVLPKGLSKLATEVAGGVLV